MVTQVDIEVIPVWFIKKWIKENAEEGSTLDFWIKQMLKEWKLEEVRHAVK